MASTTAFCTSAKQELLVGTHDFTNSTGDTFKIALYTSTATHGAATTAYSVTNEISGTGYSAGGNTLTNVTPTTDSTSGITDFSDSQWTSSSFTAASSLIYNSTDSNKSIVVNDFGGDQTVSSGTFTIQFPTAAAGTAIIELS